MTHIEYFAQFLLLMETLLDLDACHVLLMDFEETNLAFWVAHPLVTPGVLVKLVHAVVEYLVTSDVGRHQGSLDYQVLADGKLPIGLHVDLVQSQKVEEILLA